MIAEHEIVYLPSASVMQSIRRDPRSGAPSAIAVFADPVFTSDDPRLNTGAPDGQTASTRSSIFQRLRFSQKEAEAIVAAADASKTFEAVGFDASKRTLLETDLRRYDILHFATHGALDTEHPELSGLVFSLYNREGRSIDGFLRLHEIYNLDLDARLVVLSACKTALGKEVHGEGLIGLTRGFLYAGAAGIVSTVWNIDDRASAMLMSRFYEAMLRDGLRPAEALRKAQLSMLRQPRWRDPHYWAAYGIHGEWR
jgi:CHAT domain-containing protein